MKIFSTFVVLLLISYSSNAQSDVSRITDSIEAEGKMLYKSEMASWYGTDIFLEKNKDRSKIGGYFSYSEGNIAKCIFFSRGEGPKVIGTIWFDSTYNVNNAKVDLVERKFTELEFKLYTIRSIALSTIKSDTLFERYKNTNLNLIPLISNQEKKVYVLTGPEENGVVIFGNDYLIKFDNNDSIQLKKRLHKNIIWTNYDNKSDTATKIVGAMHSHLPETGDFITATDICTFMLYEKFTTWETYTVVSANYFSFWNCKSNILVAITKEVMDKINKDQKKRNKKD